MLIRITYSAVMRVLVLRVSDVTRAFGGIIPVSTIHIFLPSPRGVALLAWT